MGGHRGVAGVWRPQLQVCLSWRVAGDVSSSLDTNNSRHAWRTRHYWSTRPWLSSTRNTSLCKHNHSLFLCKLGEIESLSLADLNLPFHQLEQNPISYSTVYAPIKSHILAWRTANKTSQSNLNQSSNHQILNLQFCKLVSRISCIFNDFQ